MISEIVAAWSLTPVSKIFQLNRGGHFKIKSIVLLIDQFEPHKP